MKATELQYAKVRQSIALAFYGYRKIPDSKWHLCHIAALNALEAMGFDIAELERNKND